MALRDLRARFVLELQDRLSAGVGAIQNRLSGLRGMVQRLSGMQILAGAFGGVAALSAARGAADFEQVLRDMAIAADRTGPAITRMVSEARTEIEALARTTSVSSNQISVGLSNLVARGLDMSEARRLLPLLARVSAASGADVAQLAQLLYTARVSAGITSAEEMETALARALRAGQLGGFELRDMARYLPGILAQASQLGVRGADGVGRVAAQLQVMRDAFGSVEEAGSGAMQLWSHLASQDTIKHFREMGVNLPGLIRDAQARGIDVFEAVMQRIRTLTRGDPFKMTELMPDQNSRQAMLGFLNGVQRYLEMRDELMRLPSGSIDRNVADRNAGAGGAFRQLDESFAQLDRRVGTALAPKLAILNAQLGTLFSWMDQMDASHPGLIDGLLGWAIAALAVAGAIGTLGFVLPAVFTGARLLLSPLRLVGSVVGGLVGVGTTAGLAIAVLAAGLVAAAVHIYRHWDRFRGFFADMWGGVRRTFGGFADFVAGIFTRDAARSRQGLEAAWSGIATFFGGLWGVVRTLFGDFVQWVDGWSNGSASAAVAYLSGVWGRMAPDIADVWRQVMAEFHDFIGRANDWTNTQVTELIGRIKAPWEALKGWFGELWRGIGQAFADIVAPIEAAIARFQAVRNRREEINREAEEAAPERRNSNPGGAAARRLYQPSGFRPGAAGPSAWSGEITVRAAPGTEVVEAEARTPEVRILAPNRGAMLGMA